MKTFWKLGVVVLMFSIVSTTLTGCLSFGDDDDDEEVVLVDGQ